MTQVPPDWCCGLCPCKKLKKSPKAGELAGDRAFLKLPLVKVIQKIANEDVIEGLKLASCDSTNP